ncbi:Leucyl-tRNA synthetase, mitochondrial, partial [Coemansia sp. RSA 454]
SLEASFSLNTAISALIKLSNYLATVKDCEHPTFGFGLVCLVKMVAPMAPSIGEELWEILIQSKCLHNLGLVDTPNSRVFAQSWPVLDASALKDVSATVVVQINGKVRFKLEDMVPDQDQSELVQIASTMPQAQKWMFEATGQPKHIVKVIHVPNKLINIIVK